MKYIIKDWHGNTLLQQIKFNSFEEAENYLCQFFDDSGWDYHEHRLNYVIQAVEV